MRLAVVGGGISGLSAAWLLSRRHEVTLFERNDYAGGHSRTVPVDEGEGAPIPIDTGFIVYNERTYPLLTRLFSELDVPTRPSDMLFSVQCNRCDIEYASNARGLFAAPGNLLRVDHHRMIGAMFRFFREAGEVLESDRFRDMTVGEWLLSRRYPDVFRRHFLTPLGGAVWSTSPSGMAEFPVVSFVRFFQNHGFLGVDTSPLWRTVVGGSAAYVKRLTASFRDRIRLNSPVERIVRHESEVEAGCVEVVSGGASHRFDGVVVAAHADEALAMLADPSNDERRLLSTIPYTTNEAVLHTDTSILPRWPAARSAWNIRLEDCTAQTPRISMTYDLTRLQAPGGRKRYLVTLNDSERIAPASRIDTRQFEHPHFTSAGQAAQAEFHLLAGRRQTWFCGAWQRFGFHEDGLASGVAVARSLGVEW